MGRSPVRGYVVRADKLANNVPSLLLWEQHLTDLGRTAIRLPTDPDDMLILVRMLLSVTHGELAALALTQPTTVVEDAD